MAIPVAAQTPKLEPVAKWTAHPLGVDQAAVSADGSIVMALGFDAQSAGSLKWFQTKDQQVMAEKPASAMMSHSMAINSAGTRVAWFADATAPVIADIATAKAVKKLASPEQAFSRGGYLAFTKSGKQMVAIDNSRLYSWDVEAADGPKTLDLKRIVYAFAVFPKTGKAIVGHQEGNWRLLKIADRTVQVFDQPTAFEALEATVRNDGSQFVARNYEEAAFVWNLDPLAKAGELPGTANLGRGICFAPSGSHILAPTGLGDTLSLFENPGGRVAAHLVGLDKFVTDARFSADGKFVVGSDRQGQVAVWNVSAIAKQPVEHIDGRPEYRNRIWVSSDGAYRIEARFVSATADKVRLEKPDGMIIEVPISRLSRDDQALLRAIEK